MQLLHINFDERSTQREHSDIYYLDRYLLFESSSVLYINQWNRAWVFFCRHLSPLRNDSISTRRSFSRRNNRKLITSYRRNYRLILYLFFSLVRIMNRDIQIKFNGVYAVHKNPGQFPRDNNPLYISQYMLHMYSTMKIIKNKKPTWWFEASIRRLYVH